MPWSLPLFAVTQPVAVIPFVLESRIFLHPFITFSKGTYKVLVDIFITAPGHPFFN